MTTEQRIESLTLSKRCIERLMKKFVVDVDEYASSYDEWLDSTRDGVLYHGRWIRASIAIKYAMPDEYERELEIYANEKFLQDKTSSPSYSELVDEWIAIYDELNTIQEQEHEQAI